MMGVSIELWRARIGGFNAGQSLRRTSTFILPVSRMLSLLHLFQVLVFLLIIGNVEMNPGPLTLSNCEVCKFVAKTAEQHIYHQRVHSSVSNFVFVCPYFECHHTYSNFRSISLHLSKHGTSRHECVAGTANFKCEYCDILINSNQDYCKHIKKKHLDQENGESIQCPLIYNSAKCNSVFNKSSAFGVHLSRCHPGWRQDYGSSALPGGPLPPSSDELSLAAGHSAHVYETEDVNMGDDDFYYDAVDSDSGSETAFESCGESCDYDQIVDYIAHFYAMLEGKHIVPSSTVDALAGKLSFISEVLQERLKENLTTALNSLGLDKNVISRVIQSVTTMDPLYNSHHINAPGDCLLTSQRRRTYYKKSFKFQEPIQINLKRDPKDTEDTIQYIDIKETLKLMLEDRTVQKCVDESFNITSDGSVLRDYIDGSVFRNSQTPSKRIDINLYMDACTCVNPLGSASHKYKMNLMYMTVGNLKPYMRSFLKSMRLVLIVNDKSLKSSERRFKKCFKRVLKDLQSLESNGINYKGEIIPVRVQFIQGDNLGQHTLGGFIESFTGTHFCRFCELSKQEFKEDCQREASWRTPESFQNDLHQKIISGVDHHHGVKRNSPFHALQHFNVCEPRLPPCLSHDLFIGGVLDCDLTSMVKMMIEKEWFTQHQLNMWIKRFDYETNDGRNKPAEFKTTKKKLGGHAVQNWTLLRLLPLLVGGKVKTDDQVWKLYLLLKSIVELICAPALSDEQVELMRCLITEYLQNRKILPNNYKPKHHFLSHYPDLFLKFGPLIFLWTMGFEHRHQFFKRVALICRNFINLGHLLASKFQLLQAYESMGPLFPNHPVFSSSSPLREEIFEENLMKYLPTLKLSEDAVRLKSLTLNEMKYKESQWLLMSSHNSSIQAAHIQLIFYDEAVCKAIVKTHQVQRWEEYGLYQVLDADPGFSVVSLHDLASPCPHAVYQFKGKQCLSLKHVFLA